MGAVTIRAGLPVLHADSDFEVLARHSALQLTRPWPPSRAALSRVPRRRSSSRRRSPHCPLPVGCGLAGHSARPPPSRCRADPSWVQPQKSSVDAEGEVRLVFIDGEFSHAVRVGPLLWAGDGVLEREIDRLRSSADAATQRTAVLHPDGRATVSESLRMEKLPQC